MPYFNAFFLHVVVVFCSLFFLVSVSNLIVFVFFFADLFSFFTFVSNPSNLRGKINPFNGKLFTDKYFEILKKRIELPVWEYREKFMEGMKEHKAFVLVGETGSGKTTQVSSLFTMYLS